MDRPFPGDSYKSPDTPVHPFSAMFPSLSFYWTMCRVLRKSSAEARRGLFTDEKWVKASLGILKGLEQSGVRLEVGGMDHFKKLEGPCVFVGNHMSTLETFILPGIIQPYRPICFVVKDSLLKYPVFKHVMRARNPIVVGRRNSKADFTAVMEGGCERLAKGSSVVLFPQSTRSMVLDPQRFNSLGVKLARKAGVPAIPIALRTDTWGMHGFFGLLRDHGPIRPALPARITFGAPIPVTGSGKEEHAAILAFITERLMAWGLKQEP